MIMHTQQMNIAQECMHDTELTGRHCGEPRLEREAALDNCSDRGVGPRRVGEERLEGEAERAAWEPPILPEGGGAPVSKLHPSDGSVGRERRLHDRLEERGRRAGVPNVTPDVTEEPKLPRRGPRPVKSVDEVEKKAHVLPPEVANAKSAFLHINTHFVPSN